MLVRVAGVVVNDGHSGPRRSGLGDDHGDSSVGGIFAPYRKIGRRWRQATRKSAEEAVRAKHRKVIILAARRAPCVGHRFGGGIDRIAPWPGPLASVHRTHRRAHVEERAGFANTME